MGPFTTSQVVIPAFAHNVKPFQAPDGKFLIYYVGEPTGEILNCTNTSISRVSSDPEYHHPKEAAGPVMIASADRLDAPASEWTHHGPMTDSVDWHSATNPSPVFLPNGSVLLFVSRRWSLSPTDSSKNKKNNWIMMANSWRGPYHNVTQEFDDAIETGEDPHVFRTKRGFHQLNHNTGPASTTLSFSADGLTWIKGGFGDAFNETVQWTNGSTTTLCRRQRPFVVMADDGMPGWLWNGVMDGPMHDKHVSDFCDHQFTWTLVQQIGRVSSVLVA